MAGDAAGAELYLTMIRRSAVLALLIAPFLIGCTASGPLGPAPVVEDGNTARIVFLRPWHFQGGGATIPLMVDGVELYGLASGQYVAFIVPVGERIVGIKSWDPNALFPTRTYPTVTLNAELGRTYYFRVYINMISRTAEAEGLDLLKQTEVARESEGDPIRTYGDCQKLGPNPTARQRALCR